MAASIDTFVPSAAEAGGRGLIGSSQQQEVADKVEVIGLGFEAGGSGDGDCAALDPAAAAGHRPLRGVRLTTNDAGRPVVTPLFFVFLAIDTTDLLFALDSIPTVFGSASSCT